MVNITIREIARQAGVSVATVSRAINPHTSQSVKKSTKNKILKIIKKMDYLPSPVAKGLATGRSMNIVVFLGTKYKSLFYNDYYMKLLTGIMEVLEETPYTLIIRMMKLRESVFDLNSMIKGLDVGASIVCDLPGVLQVSASGLDNLKIPAVVLNRTDKKPGVSFIACDNFKAAYEATKYLISLGHRRIAIIKGSSHEKDSIERFEGYVAAMADSSIHINESHVYEGDFSERTGMRAIETFMTLKDKPTAVFCANDEIAIGALIKLDEVGLRCPSDVSVMGFDGIDMGRYLIPKLTTMRQPIYEMAREAAKEIINCLEKKRGPGTIKLFDAHIVKGGTCAKAPHLSPQPEAQKKVA
jgi:LacI family transcriptional regulator